MDILNTISFENEGNDSWIKKSFTIINDLGKKYLIYHKSVSGWSNYDEFRTLEIDNDFDFKKFFESELDSADCYRVMRDWFWENGVEDLDDLGEEKETDHILINNGEMFDGTRKSLRNTYLENANNEEIKGWCHDMDFTLRINGKKIF